MIYKSGYGSDFGLISTAKKKCHLMIHAYQVIFYGKYDSKVIWHISYDVIIIFLK